MKKIIMVLLTVSGLLISTLLSCGNEQATSTNNSEVSQVTESAESDKTSKEPSVETTTEEITTESEIETTAEVTTTESAPDDGMTETQRNSLSMLNYLTVLSQEIIASNNSRLFLQDAYSSLINNTYPNAVDERTQEFLENLMDSLENFQMLNVKRERIQYLQEQSKANAIKAVVPSPITELTNIISKDVFNTAVSIIDFAMDSVTEYMSAINTSEFLTEGWELDDEETQEINNTRRNAFSYMLDIVRENEISGDYAINENAVNELVDWKNNTNATRRIQFLESNQDKYKAVGEYWLVLAESYYEIGNYEKCLSAIEGYESLGTRLFRKDYNYAKVLPLVLVAASEVYPEADYTVYAEKTLPVILDNSEISDWALNYYVAQNYVDLYIRTNDKEYLTKAYNNQINVVNSLIDEQKKLNKSYLDPVQELSVEKDADKDKKEEVKKYNNMILDQRKTELPPIYEPLYVNCDLLFAIANELDIPETEKTTIEKMLHEKDEPLFLNRFIENKISFKVSDDISYEDLEFNYSKGEVTVPAELMNLDSIIKGTVNSNGDATSFDEWFIKEVKRGSDNVNDFSAIYSSSDADSYDYTDGDIVEISIYENDNTMKPIITVKFEAKESKTLGIISTIEFQRID